MTSQNDILILGAGPAGLSAAYALDKQGCKTTLLERADFVGGMSSSIVLEGCTLDLGPHFFATDLPEIERFWDEVLGSDQVRYTRRTRMYWHHSLFQYPPNPLEVFKGIGLAESVRLAASFLGARHSRSDPSNQAQQMRRRYGERLSRSCFEGYIEKLCGVPCSAMSPEWQAGSLRNTSLGEILRKFFIRGGDGTLRHPKHGCRQLYERLSGWLTDSGHDLRLQQELIRLEHHEGRVVAAQVRVLSSGTEYRQPVQEVISSIPLPILVQQLSPAPPEAVLTAARSLTFRSTVLVYLLVETASLFPDQCLYINDASIALGRVTNFANWSAQMTVAGVTPLCCEYWCDLGSDTWNQTEEAICARAEDDLKKIGVLREETVRTAKVVRLPRSHPVITLEGLEAMATLQEYLSHLENLQVIGRYGGFRYVDQDGSLTAGFAAAQTIIERRKASPATEQ
jgi:protoporphyrinogen oxidase